MTIVESSTEGDVVVLTWNDDENRYRPDSVAALRSALAEAAGREGPLAVVLTGTGKFFSNGLDLDWMSANPDLAPAMLAEVHRLFVDVLSFPAITVAAINGHAFAGGAMLASAFDIRLMRADRGWWCVPEGNLGLPFTEGMASLLRSTLPSGTAQRAMLTAHRFVAEEAVTTGIAHEAVALDDLVPRAVELASSMTGLARNVTTVTKRQLHDDAVQACLRTAERSEAGGIS